MAALLDAFWRAVAYCLHPRVILLSLLPLVLMVVGGLGLAYFWWDSAVNSVFLWLEAHAWIASLGRWLQEQGLGGLKNVLAPLVVIFGVTPFVVFAVLLVVSLAMMPALVNLVAARRFPDLERKRGASLLHALAWSLGSTLLAVLAMIVSLPLWLVPPLILVLPPLIWGWLTYRVMAFDALAEHASAEERQAILRAHRPALVGMGVLTGTMGAAPSVVWASGWLFAAAFVVLIPVAIWIYTLVFAFSSLWFSHYTLAALARLRAASALPPLAEASAATDAVEMKPREPEPLVLPLPPAT